MTKSLFTDFESVSAKEWKQKIQYDLKGADYNEALIYKTLEGIDIKPFYNSEDVENLDIHNQNPTSWNNCLKIEVNNAEEGNAKAIDGIKKGAESIYFIVKVELENISVLFDNIENHITFYIETSFLSLDFCKKLNSLAKASHHNIYLLTDVIGNLAAQGNWYNSLNEDLSISAKIVSECDSLQSALSIDMSLYQNAGAHIVQQLAYGIAHVNEYLNRFENDKESVPLNKIVFKVSVGGNYFFEIAKLKALRLLWNSLINEYNIKADCHILASPGLRNKSILDYNVNMLRTTTECMSTVLGGADTVFNQPYDTIYHLENEFGTRIALNQLLILKDESYFDTVNNPASGSYYIESITNSIAEEALDVFKSIEKAGGFLTQLKEGTIQRKIKESATKEQELLNNSDIVLTGVNKYSNQEEIIPEVQKELFLLKKKRKTLIEPIITRRLAEVIEKKRLDSADY